MLADVHIRTQGASCTQLHRSLHRASDKVANDVAQLQPPDETDPVTIVYLEDSRAGLASVLYRELMQAAPRWSEVQEYVIKCLGLGQCYSRPYH